MTRLAVLSAGCVLWLLGCAGSLHAGEVTQDELLRMLLVGTWEQTSEVYAVSQFTAGMHYRADIYRSRQQQEVLGRLRGVWWVEDGYLKIRLREVVPARWPLGTQVVEKIESVNGRKLILIDEKGERYAKLRLR